MTRRARPVGPVHPKCPKCANAGAIPYVYGSPDGELLESEKRGECILAGCVVWPGQPAFRCRVCGAQFTKEGRDPVTLEEVQQAHTYDSRPATPTKRRTKP
jgi:hypothetical protein